MPPIPISVPLSNPATPVVYQLQGTGEIDIKSIAATFDGASAMVDFYPVISIYSSDDRLLSRTRVCDAILAGGSGVVTFAPFLRKPCPPGGGGALPSNDNLPNAIAILPTVTPGGSSYIFPADYTFTGVIDGSNVGATLDSWRDPINYLMYGGDGIGGANYSVWYQGVVPAAFDANPSVQVTVDLGIVLAEESALAIYFPIRAYTDPPALYPSSAMELTQFIIDGTWNVAWNTLLAGTYALGVVSAVLNQADPFYVEVVGQNETGEAADPITPGAFTLGWRFT